MIIAEVSTTSTYISFTFQDPPEPGRRIIIHQANRHPVGSLPIPFFELAAFRLNKVRENRPETPLPEFTPKEVEEAIERFNAAAPAEGQVIDYRPGPDRWSR